MSARQEIIPQVMLLPASARYNAQALADIGGMLVYWAPERREPALVFRMMAPIDLRSRSPRSIELETMALKRERFCHDTRLSRRERRALARRGRPRRRAVSMPRSISEEVHVFAPDGTPERTLLRAAEVARYSAGAT